MSERDLRIITDSDEDTDSEHRYTVAGDLLVEQCEWPHDDGECSVPAQCGIDVPAHRLHVRVDPPLTAKQVNTVTRRKGWFQTRSSGLTHAQESQRQ